MSIRKMIALHPDVAGHVNQPLGDAAHHLMYCARMCLSCADACAAEKMDMAQCIRLCLDCADMCEAAGRLAARRPGRTSGAARDAGAVRPGLRRLRRRVERHDQEHCKLCAQMCRECAEDCRNAAASITPARLKANNHRTAALARPCAPRSTFLTIMSRFSREIWSMNRTPFIDHLSRLKRDMIVKKE